MSHESETWCLWENEMAILRVKKAMCGAKLIEERIRQELMSLLGEKETLGRLAKAKVKKDERWILKRWQKARATKDGREKTGGRTV